MSTQVFESVTRFTSRAAVPIVVILCLTVGVAAMLFTGAAEATLLNDPGPYVRFGLPAAKFVFNISMALTLGALMFALLILPRTQGRGRSRRTTPAAASSGTPGEAPLNTLWEKALKIAGVASVAWTISAVAVLVLTFADTVGAQAYLDFSAQLGVFLTQIAFGQLWTLIVVLIAVASTLCFGTRSYIGIAVAGVLGVGAMIPLALMGHSAAASGHTQAVNSIGLHLLGVTIWLGGLLVIALLGSDLARSDQLRTTIERYSSFALIAFAIVAYSGVVNSLLRVHSLGDLMTPYGQVIVAKTIAAILLGLVGFWHRQFVIRRLGAVASATREFWRLIVVEFVIFGATMGLAVALSRSQPPVSQEPVGDPSPAEILTGEPLPPPPTFARYFTEWSLDPLWVVVAVGLSAAYIVGFINLRRRGDAWPIHRLICWLLGMIFLVYVTSGGARVYGEIQFSAHMIQHMLLIMVVPLPMVLGAPITMLMRGTKARTDGSRGIREWVLWLVHTPYMRFFANPIFASVNFAGSLVIFYYSGVMKYALEWHLGHELMIIHFLGAGYLFAQALIGIDPGVKRPAYPLRLLMLLITMAFHAFFGISIMSSEVLIEGDWFGNIGADWGYSAIEDQQLGGGIAWGVGEFPTLFIAIMVAFQWSKSSDREAKRVDRREARTDDAELRAYNDMLATMAQRDAKADQRGR
ncbi:MAG: bifunctional copper resistance protein CopD/cytochrome c oxidase assembly protein [Brevibacterium sp.]|nr:cytochrome c oxidase assembly protein [Brevibacterium sp.]MDN6158033.1 bifunctional copper resistance protein CopD/cytochrome c oxidase assembly protein [Brevibacterium sp.]MDN6176116.1 bifunctional copper resistance protein CopD/cytochrome c oxidase assembly protein [Brevibacterium sp.]MDN6528564.1 bifunctional copper resistance protein CopD/cytochrome c oxidase assembly protein [Brevibacterium sp.]MDN6604445.1 bifunctional copper resistance protein CopD/cytochrome c oxidase assembly protei